MELFYAGLDTKNTTMMDSHVANEYQAIFTEGCVEVGGASHCGAGAAAALKYSSRREVEPATV